MRSKRTSKDPPDQKESSNWVAEEKSDLIRMALLKIMVHDQKEAAISPIITNLTTGSADIKSPHIDKLWVMLSAAMAMPLRSGKGVDGVGILNYLQNESTMYLQILYLFSWAFQGC